MYDQHSWPQISHWSREVVSEITGLCLHVEWGSYYDVKVVVCILRKLYHSYLPCFNVKYWIKMLNIESWCKILNQYEVKTKKTEKDVGLRAAYVDCGYCVRTADRHVTCSHECGSQCTPITHNEPTITEWLKFRFTLRLLESVHGDLCKIYSSYGTISWYYKWYQYYWPLDY